MDDYSDFQHVHTIADEDTSGNWHPDEEAEISPTVKSSISLIICIIGLIGNVTVIFVMTTLKEYRKSVTNWYVLQLAIADILFLLMIPFQVDEYLQGAWIYPEWFCKAMSTIRFHNYYASILFFTMMSIDRYIAVCHSLSVRLNQLREMKAAVIIATSIWIIALLLCIPVMLYSFKIGLKPDCLCSVMFPVSKTNQIENIEIEDKCRKENVTEMAFQECLKNQIRPITQTGDVYCIGKSDQYEANYYGNETTFSHSGMQMKSNETDYYDYDVVDYNVVDIEIPVECYYGESLIGWFVFIWFNFIAMFIFPFTVMSICYGLIIYRISSSNALAGTPKKSNQSKKSKQVTQSDRDKIRITKMCAALVMSFLLSWILFHATHIAKIFGIRNATSGFCERLALASSFIAYLNSALNPFLYSFLNPKFKERLQKAARAWLKKDIFSSKEGSSSQPSGSKRKRNASKSSERKTFRIFTGKKSLSSIEQTATTESQSNQM